MQKVKFQELEIGQFFRQDSEQLSKLSLPINLFLKISEQTDSFPPCSSCDHHWNALNVNEENFFRVHFCLQQNVEFNQYNNVTITKLIEMMEK
jgi:hypothetical protein